MGVHLFAEFGHITAEGGETQQAPSMWPLLLIAGLFLAFMMWSNRNRQKRAAQFRSSLRPGQRVQLMGGIIGNLVTIGEREAFVELAPGVVVTAVPQAIQGIVNDPEAEVEVEDSAVDPSDEDSGQ